MIYMEWFIAKPANPGLALSPTPSPTTILTTTNTLTNTPRPQHASAPSSSSPANTYISVSHSTAGSSSYVSPFETLDPDMQVRDLSQREEAVLLVQWLGYDWTLCGSSQSHSWSCSIMHLLLSTIPYYHRTNNALSISMTCRQRLTAC